MSKKNQSKRLTTQHKESQGVKGIFGQEAKMHDKTTGDISHQVKNALEHNYPKLKFRYRQSLKKNENNHHRNASSIDFYLLHGKREEACN